MYSVYNTTTTTKKNLYLFRNWIFVFEITFKYLVCFDWQIVFVRIFILPNDVNWGKKLGLNEKQYSQIYFHDEKNFNFFFASPNKHENEKFKFLYSKCGSWQLETYANACIIHIKIIYYTVHANIYRKYIEQTLQTSNQN